MFWLFFVLFIIYLIVMFSFYMYYRNGLKKNDWAKISFKNFKKLVSTFEKSYTERVNSFYDSNKRNVKFTHNKSNCNTDLICRYDLIKIIKGNDRENLIMSFLSYNFYFFWFMRAYANVNKKKSSKSMWQGIVEGKNV